MASCQMESNAFLKSTKHAYIPPFLVFWTHCSVNQWRVKTVVGRSKFLEKFNQTLPKVLLLSKKVSILVLSMLQNTLPRMLVTQTLLQLGFILSPFLLILFSTPKERIQMSWQDWSLKIAFFANGVLCFNISAEMFSIPQGFPVYQWFYLFVELFSFLGHLEKTEIALFSSRFLKISFCAWFFGFSLNI